MRSNRTVTRTTKKFGKLTFFKDRTVLKKFLKSGEQVYVIREWDEAILLEVYFLNEQKKLVSDVLKEFGYAVDIRFILNQTRKYEKDFSKRIFIDPRFLYEEYFEDEDVGYELEYDMYVGYDEYDKYIKDRNSDLTEFREVEPIHERPDRTIEYDYFEEEELEEIRWILKDLEK